MDFAFYIANLWKSLISLFVRISLHRLVSLLPAGSSQQKLAFKTLVSVPLENKETADLLSPLIPNMHKMISVFTVSEQRELLLFLVEKLSTTRYFFIRMMYK